MQNYLLLLSPRIISTFNRFRSGREGSAMRLVFMGLVAFFFWSAIFVGSYKVLGYFQGAEGFGDILARKLMGMLWLTFFSILLFSNVITSLSTFFLSKDLETIHAAPIDLENIFWARLTDTLVDSSWMIIFFGLPVFIAYGIVYQAGFIYYGKLFAVTVPFLVLATSLAVIFTMLLVNVFPARRTRDILFLLSIMLIIVLYLLFRFMRPEKLVNPEGFSSTVSYFASLRTPASPMLPSYWASEVLWPSLAPGKYSEAGFNLLMLYSTSAAFTVIASWVSAALYRNGFSKAQEGARRIIAEMHPIDIFTSIIGRKMDPASRVLMTKDIKTFFRDNTQWSQLLLLLALIVIYLYNFSVLDLHRFPIRAFYLQNALSFLNIGLASFVVASLAVRFIFPAVSQEGFSWWIIRSSPLTLNRFLWTKFWIYAPPLVIVAEILIILTNYLLNVTSFMMVLSSVTVFFIVLGIVGLGIGLGAIYPRFEAENMAAVATGFGGMIFMILSAIYIALVVFLEAWPVSVYLRAIYRKMPVEPWMYTLAVICFLVVMALNALALFYPMHVGKKRLLERESN